MASALCDIEIINPEPKIELIVWDYIFHRLPNDPICHIFSFSSFNELALFSIICKQWNKLIKPNNRLWVDLCQSFWKDKVYVPSQYRNLIKGSITRKSMPDEDSDEKKEELECKETEECVGRKAFRLAYIDRKRTTLTVDELVTFRWYFRFKEQAGQTWLDIDPWWNLNDDDFVDVSDQNNGDNDNNMGWDDSDDDNDNDDEDSKLNEEELLKYKPSELVGILTDDEIEEYKLKQLKYQQLVRQNSLQYLKEKKVLTEHEQRLLRCTRIKFQRDGHMDWQQNRRMNDMVNTQEFIWRFGGTFYKGHLYGNAVQVNSYPKKYVSRHPINWGWVMQSCWVVYTSFPMPMVGSIDDQLITEEDFSVRGYAEMIQYNYMGGVTRQRHDTSGHDISADNNDDELLINKDGKFNLEKLREIQHKALNLENGKNPNDTLDENDTDLQHAIAQFFLQRWTAIDSD